MPRWARFVSCTVTGLLVALAGFALAGYWWEGGAGFWQSWLDFMATPAFRGLVLRFGLLLAAGLLLARLWVHYYPTTGSMAGLITGGLTGLAYALALTVTYAGRWGGLAAGLQKSWPAMLLFGLAFGLGGSVSGWLWERLD
jgi:hypothetical protein